MRAVPKKSVKVIVEGGKASAGPPLGPSLGPLGVNVFAVVEKINELTKEFSGMKVPVEVIVDTETKEFEVKVGIPTTSALIVRAAKIEKGSGEAGSKFVGNITMKDVIEIAKIKMPQLLSKTLKAAVKQVVGTCVSMGVTIDGKDPREVMREIKEGKYDDLLKD